MNETISRCDTCSKEVTPSTAQAYTRCNLALMPLEPSFYALGNIHVCDRCMETMLKRVKGKMVKPIDGAPVEWAAPDPTLQTQ